MPQLLPTSGSSTFTVTPAPTTLAYTGPTSVTNGQSATLSGVLTSSEPSPGTDVSGQTVTFTVGFGQRAPELLRHDQLQRGGELHHRGREPDLRHGRYLGQLRREYLLPVVHSGLNGFGSHSDHADGRAGTSDFADAGTVSAVLTNSITGAGIPGEPVTLTLNGTQSCNGTTNASGAASCSITPNEPAATYTLARVVRRRHHQGAAAACRAQARTASW